MKENKNRKNILAQSFALLITIVLLGSAAITQHGKLWGHDMKAKATTESEAANDTLKVLEDGTMIIKTTQLGKDIIGYAGQVPLEITIKDKKVVGVKALKNTETPEFFESASELLTSWNGMAIDEAQKLKVDAVSGATFSSKAIIGNMQRGLQYAAKNAEKPSVWDKFDCSPKAIAGIIVVLMAAILPLFIHDKRYRLFQQALNIIVLGFWCGTFLNYSSMLGMTANGINVIVAIIPCIMLITAFIYPFFGKKAHYCTHVCPYGASQELIGKIFKYKIPLKGNTLTYLNVFRRTLWIMLMFLLLFCAMGSTMGSWIDYEPFSAFMFSTAPVAAIVIAVLFLLLSTVVVRPYCRFVCPTGTLLNLQREVKWKKK